jgi:hypothetical protein
MCITGTGNKRNKCETNRDQNDFSELHILPFLALGTKNMK